MSAERRTYEEAIALARDWAEGRRSHINEFMQVERTPDDRPQTLADVAVADAAETFKWASLAIALRDDQEVDT